MQSRGECAVGQKEEAENGEGNTYHREDRNECGRSGTVLEECKDAGETRAWYARDSKGLHKAETQVLEYTYGNEAVGTRKLG